MSEEICGVYVNSGELRPPPGGVVETVVEVPLPLEAVTGVVGHKMGVWTFKEGQKSACTIFLHVNGANVDHFKARGAGQQSPHFLPAGYQFEGAPKRVHLLVRAFNEGQEEVVVRANAWVWFVMLHNHVV